MLFNLLRHLLFLAIALAAGVSPAGAGTVRGTVRDRNASPGNPLDGVTIYLWQHGGAWASVVRSGPDGYYEADVPDGRTYNLAANKPGLAGWQRAVSMGTADNVRVSGGAVVRDFDLDAPAPVQQRPAFAARLVSTAYAPAAIEAGQSAVAWLLFENAGGAGWDGATRLAVSNARFAEPGRAGGSVFQAASWLSSDRPAAVGGAAPGTQRWVRFDLRAPAQPGRYELFLELVQEGVAWFDGPGDDVRLSIDVTAPPRPAGIAVDAQGRLDAAILAEYGRRGAAAVGLPFDNGGGAPVHRWGPRGSVQDFRGGRDGQSLIIHADGAARAFSVGGAALSAYFAVGGPGSFLGSPIGDAAPARQSFDGGALESRGGVWIAVRAGARPQDRFGLDVNAPVDARGNILVDAAAVAATGARTARINFLRGPWSSPEDGRRFAGRTWLEAYDAIVDGLGARGVSVYGLINTEAIEDDPGPLRGLGDPAGARAYADRYARAAHAIVAHFRDRVRTFELVNEPNDWAGGQQPRVHAAWFALILARAYTAVKLDHAADPTWQVRLCSGPLFSFAGTYADGYLREAYQHGKRSAGWDAIRARAGTYPVDGVGYHIYDLEDAADRPAKVAAVFGAHLDAMWAALLAEDPEGRSKRFYVSEFGWRSSHGEDHQADMLEAGFAALGGDARVALAVYFCLTDWEADGYGLRHASGAPKGSLARFSGAVR